MTEKPLTILLVGANPPDVHFLKELLRETEVGEWTVTHVECLREALQRLPQGNIQAVLLDPGLPDSSGLDTIKQVHAAAPNVPIVVLADLQEEEFALHAVREGAQDYLVKAGLDRQVLVRALQLAMERKRADALKAARNRVLELVALGRSLPEVLVAVAHALEEQFLEVRCSVMLLGVDGNHLHVGAAPRLPAEFTRAVEGLEVGPSAGACGTAAWRREPVIAADIAADPLWAEFRDLALKHGLRACWSQPILSGAGKTLGTICLYYPEPRSPNLLERQLVEAIAHLAGLAIEHKQGEERLALYHQIFVNSNDGIAVLDPQGYYLEQNAAHRAILGHSDDELRGRTPALHLGEEQFSQTFRELVRRGQYRGELTHCTKTGEKRILDLSAFGVQHDSGDPLCYVWIERDITERKRAKEQLEQSHDQLRSLSVHLESVREEERIRIARDLHDEVGQGLTGLKLEVAWLEKRLLDSKGEMLGFPMLVKFRAMSRLIDAMTDSVRRISAELRPGVLDQIGLLPAIEWQAQQFQARTGITCKVNLLLRQVQLDQGRTTAVFRIFQEILTNVARHAKATEVLVTVRESVGNLVVEVRDNGRGITETECTNPQAFGILGMQERAVQCGGEVTILGSQGKGTRVVVRVPFGRGEK